MAGAAGGKGAAEALARFQAENGVTDVNPDAIYAYDRPAQVQRKRKCTSM